MCGDAAVLFDPNDLESIAAAVLETDERREELQERGSRAGGQFTWDETARGTKRSTAKPSPIRVSGGVRVGISLLTLVPGISGGSETYARELCRALAEVGELEYEVLLPSIAADVEGPRARVIDGYRASRSTSGRLRAMAATSLGRHVRGSCARSTPSTSL